jgi:hypothetical protein
MKTLNARELGVIGALRATAVAALIVGLPVIAGWALIAVAVSELIYEARHEHRLSVPFTDGLFGCVFLIAGNTMPAGLYWTETIVLAALSLATFRHAYYQAAVEELSHS